MSIGALVDNVYSTSLGDWTQRNKDAFEGLFGSASGRYSKSAAKSVTLRAPGMSPEFGVPFAAYIHPSNPQSGPYSGLSFVLFPVENDVSLIGMGVGTQGLTPDEAILGRPGHARKVQAICSWLNQEYGKGKFIAWAKQDPTRTDLTIPANVRNAWPAYKDVFDRYGKEMYALYCPTGDRGATESALKAFLDVLFEERGYQPNANCQADYKAIQASWFEHIMPKVDRSQVASLLARRRYVILQGPPGTGKTRMATQLLKQEYGGRGRSIQFHSNTTYENFIGGLTPVNTGTDLGLQFAPTPGVLMEVAHKALDDQSHDYLLHIDEINRADLAKVLGEAIFLLEEKPEVERKIDLPYDFGKPFYRTLFIPKNLHIVGTMNSADRSIAIVDIALRRRFAFVSVWPRMSVVEEHGCASLQQAFRDLVSIFVEYAAEDAFPLLPGHSYFLESDENRAKENLRFNLAPLLEEYLAQGYVSGFAESIRAYLQQIIRL